MHYLSYFFSKNNHVVHTIIWSRGVIVAVQSVWSAIFPLNQNFRFDQIWHRHRTNWITIDSVRPTFDFFQFLRNQIDQRGKKSLFPFAFPHFLSNQTPSTKKKTQNHVYIQRSYQNKKIYISLCFPTFSHHPNTKHQAK